MKSESAENQRRSQDELLAEAGVWLARLQSSDRTASVDDGFRKWLKENARHAAAFEAVTDVWERAAGLRRGTGDRMAQWERPGIRVRLSRVAMTATLAIFLTTLGTVFYLEADGFATSVGEQRILTLEDGSRVYLNTATQAKVLFDEKVRRVRLDHGEAMFEVAQNAARPFEVIVGDRLIQALGTAFVVRQDVQSLSVTLVEGKVAVSPVTGPLMPGALSAGSVVPDPPGEEIILLAPGERLTLAVARAPQIDRPALDKVTAWQRGQVALDGQTLIEGAAEMNRYSTTRLVVDSARAADLHVSGVFRAGDSENFALGLAETYGFHIVKGRKTIVIRDPENRTPP